MDGFWNALASLGPFLGFAAAVITLLLMIRLGRRMSTGSQSAGPRHTEPATPVGLRQTPWEVEAIDRQLQSKRGSSARRDLIVTVNRLSAAAHQQGAIGEYIPNLPVDADNDRIASVISRLESRMEFRSRAGPEPGATGNPDSAG